MKKIILILIICAAVIGIYFYANSGPQGPQSVTQSQSQTKKVYVKYREDGPVNVNNSDFDYQNTSNSSLVGGAWYDKSEEYMVIKLRDIYYHYCDLPQLKWSSFKKTDSFGSFYDSKIKGNYSCRYKDVPSY